MTGVPISNLFKTFDLFDLLDLNLHQCLKIFPLYPSSALTCCFGVVVIAVPNINKKTNEKIVIFFNREPVYEDIMQWDKLYYVGGDAAQSGTLQGEIAAEVICGA